jgi:peptidoglycan/LPS O-acetylase OafA/YrhL
MEPRHYDFIDALRGYAILMVIGVHSSQYFEYLATNTLVGAGARGVQLFFVASGVTLCLSWMTRNDGAIAFYVRRLFRIAPMFYLAIVFFVVVNRLGPNMYAPDGVGLRHILMSATFTHGLMPDTITSLVPGSWSIADEMMFYAAFPLLMAIAVRVRLVTATILTALATVLCVHVQNKVAIGLSQMNDPVWQPVWGVFYYLWIVNQLPCFLFGMLVGRWIYEGRRTPWPALLVVGSVTAVVINATYGIPVRQWNELSVPMQFGLIFAIFALGLSKWQPVALVNPVIGWIGKVSYSGYLIHLALISALTTTIPHANFLEAFAILAGLTIPLSTITYLCVEQPFNRFGRRLARRVLTAENVIGTTGRIYPGQGASGSMKPTTYC